LTTQLSDGRDRQGPPAAAEGPRRRSEAGAGAGASGPTQAHVPRQSRDMSIPERGTAPAEPSSPSGARHETSFAFNWLTEIGMGAYASAFVRAGFEEKDVLSAIEDKDFDEIEKFAGVAVKPGRRKKILLHARRLAATLASPATPPGPPGPADPAFTPSPVPVYRASSVDSPLPDASARALEGDVEERESDMAFTRVVPRGGVPTKSANSHSKRPRSSHQAMELEILAAEVSSASVALPVSAPDADVAPLPMGAASPRNDDGPSAARRSYRRQGGRSGRVRGWASEINTGASPGVPGARPNAVFPMLAAADGAAHARAAVEAEAAGPPDDLSRDRSHSAGPANAEGRDGAARAAGGAPESGWWVGSPPRGTAAIPLRRNVPIDREPWARSRFRLFQAELEAHVAKVAASVRAGGADRPLTSISFVRLAREAKTTANLRRQAIEVELGLQRRVQDIKAGLRRRNAA